MKERDTTAGKRFTEHVPDQLTAITPPEGFTYFRRVSAFGADSDIFAFKNTEGVETQIPISRIAAIQNQPEFITEITTNTTCAFVYTSV